MPRHFAVLPAAGASQRMGTSKLLLPWGERCLLEHVLSVWTASNLDGIVILLPPDQPELARRAQAFKIEVVAPLVRPADMKQSVRLGLARLAEWFKPATHDAWLLAPVDLPAITADIVRAVVEFYDQSPGEIVAPFYKDRRVHPVALPWSAVAKIDDLAGGQGIDSIVKAGPVRRLNLDVPDLLDDLDTPDDYMRLHNRYFARKPN